MHPVALGKGQTLAHEVAQVAGVTCSSSVPRSRSRLRLCRTGGGCAVETPRRRPARSRCEWPGGGSRLGCAHAKPGRFRPSDLPRSRRSLGGFADTGRSTPSGRSPWQRRSSRVHPTPAHRLFRRARARLRHGPADHCSVARKKAASLPPLSETLLPAEAGDVLALDELHSFVGSKWNARWVWVALCRRTRQVVAYFRGGSFGRQCPRVACAHPAGLLLPGHAQRLLAGLCRDVSPAHAPFVRQRRGPNLLRRALEQHAAPASWSLRAPHALLFQVRPDA